MFKTRYIHLAKLEAAIALFRAACPDEVRIVDKFTTSTGSVMARGESDKQYAVDTISGYVAFGWV